MRHELLSDPPGRMTAVTDDMMKDVHIAYKCDAFDDHESLALVQNLVDNAVERLLAKTRKALGEKEPIRICVEHCQKRNTADALLSDLRYLKVYVEGHGPCIVMAY